MNSAHFFALLVVSCILSADIILPVVAHHHHRGNHGIELLLAAGILAKLLHKKGHHHHHHHGHHHHGHHHHGHHHSGSSAVEMSIPAPLGGYAYPAPAASTFSSSVEYPQPPYVPAASQAYPVPQMPAAAGFMGFEAQPMAMAPPMGF